MNKYQIIADNVQLDTYEEIDISLNYQIDDILDISKRNTSYSKTIILPGTTNNTKFFHQIFDVNIDNITFNPNVRIKAIVRIGDNEIFNGYLRLTNIFNNNNEITYEANIQGSLKDIMTTIADYSLRDLDMSEYDHVRDMTNIEDSWTYNIQKFGANLNVGEPGDGYVYPYIVNGNSSDITHIAYIYDLFPAPYVKTVVDKLFDFAGFTYTSDFLESDYFKKLILPYTGEKLQLTKEQLDNITQNIGENMNAVCTGCGYCLPCQADINIPAYMQVYNSKQMFGVSDKDMKKEVSDQRIWGILVSSAGHASDCIQCGECEEACTQHLNIIERLEEMAKWEEGIS